jgi:hypothetical protein
LLWGWPTHPPRRPRRHHARRQAADRDDLVAAACLGLLWAAEPKFEKLAAVLRKQLTGIKVFKVGDEAEKQAFVVGKTSDGKWAGLKTTVVET